MQRFTTHFKDSNNVQVYKHFRLSFAFRIRLFYLIKF